MLSVRQAIMPFLRWWKKKKAQKNAIVIHNK